MENFFGSMMQGLGNSMSEEDKQKMAAMCPCCNMKDMPEEDKKAMMEKMQSFCGDKMGMMSSFVQCAGSSK